jgi:hypothetical protein
MGAWRVVSGKQKGSAVLGGGTHSLTPLKKVQRRSASRVLGKASAISRSVGPSMHMTCRYVIEKARRIR